MKKVDWNDQLFGIPLWFWGGGVALITLILFIIITFMLVVYASGGLAGRPVEPTPVGISFLIPTATPTVPATDTPTPVLTPTVVVVVVTATDAPTEVLPPATPVPSPTLTVVPTATWVPTPVGCWLLGSGAACVTGGPGAYQCWQEGEVVSQNESTCMGGNWICVADYSYPDTRWHLWQGTNVISVLAEPVYLDVVGTDFDSSKVTLEQAGYTVLVEFYPVPSAQVGLVVGQLPNPALSECLPKYVAITLTKGIPIPPTDTPVPITPTVVPSTVTATATVTVTPMVTNTPLAPSPTPTP